MRRLLALLVLCTLSPLHAAPPPVSLDTLVSARMGRAPMTVRFRATVQPDQRNRQLCFDWVSDASSGQGCTPLEGDQAPLTTWRDITFRTSGEFIVSARLERNDGHTLLSNIVTIHVYGLGD